MEAVDRALRSEAYCTLLTREPGGTPAGEAVREIFLAAGGTLTAIAEALLINASRAELVAQVLRPALAGDTVVLCDRYVDSTIAYQGYGRGLPLEPLRAMCDAATGGLVPDLTFFVDVSYETSRQRLAERGGAHDRMEQQDREFYERARAGFLEISRNEARVVVLDGERSPESVAEAAMDSLNAVLP